MNSNKIMTAICGCALLMASGSVWAAKDCDAGGNGSMSEGTYRALERVHEQIAENEYKEAEERLGRLLSRGNDYEKAVVYQTLGFVKIQQNDFKTGLDAFEKALALGGLPPLQAEQLKYNAGQLYIADGNYTKGIRTLEEYMAEACGEIPADAHIQLAAGYAEKKQFRKALQQVDLALSKSKEPKEQWLQLKLALHYELKEFPACADVLVKLIALVPSKADYFKQLSGIYFEIKKDPDSLAVLALAQRQGLFKKESEYKNLASVYMLLEIPYQAAETFEKAIEAGNVQPTEKNLEFLGDAWLSAREYRKSANALKRAAQVNQSGDIWKRLAQVLVEEENWVEAIEAADAAVKAGVKQPGEALMVKGLAAYNAGRPNTAIAAFKQALRQEESRKQARQWLNYVETELADIAAAEAAAAELKAQREAQETQTN